MDKLERRYWRQLRSSEAISGCPSLGSLVDKSQVMISSCCGSGMQLNLEPPMWKSPHHVCKTYCEKLSLPASLPCNKNKMP